ncbi:WD40-repeat-containing domain protein [Lobosporangium transversale]|uniref:WD40-repeat-containing domain protein n=1 Tax=Lobosporangium transversale TaxID=64571 RepID=A0A1Y2GTL1_9FUNG|nr:WD40-repeat-containing domain protein [Lobosporangium transversale]ORZ21035.1 WD40-repeat-containing domain protein [Lobosporangium transversale]|eukprot:XP_021882944.1 WD40-repeat-containing domain protein [Lobosporangium transversale]
MHAREIESAVSGHEDVNVVDFSPCERYIISCSHRNEIAVFDRRFMNRPPLHRLHHADTGEDDLNAGITSALWWSQGSGTSQSMLMTGGGDGAVKLWDIRRATEDAETWSFEANLGPIARLAASPLFEHLIIGGDSGTVSVYTLDHSMISHYKDHPMTLLSYDN